MDDKVSAAVNAFLEKNLGQWMIARQIARNCSLGVQEVNRFLYNSPQVPRQFVLETKKMAHGKAGNEKPHYRFTRKVIGMEDEIVLVALEKLVFLNSPISKTDLYNLALSALSNESEEITRDELERRVDMDCFWKNFLVKIGDLLKADQMLRIHNDHVLIRKFENKRLLFSVGNKISVEDSEKFHKFFHIEIDREMVPPFTSPLNIKYIPMFLEHQTHIVWKTNHIQHFTIAAIIGAIQAVASEYHVVVVDNDEHNLSEIVLQSKGAGENISLYSECA